jgi:hypothetical protein
MTALIVKVDAVEQVGFRLLVAGVTRQVHPFGLQRAEETRHRRIVSAVPWSRMAGHIAKSPKQGLVVVGAVLAATIRVQPHLRLWLAACSSHLQRGLYQGLLHPVVYRPADDGA